jgi:peptidoglycan hydrolase-like protein with peptidoglycan-binding domain
MTKLLSRRRLLALGAAAVVGTPAVTIFATRGSATTNSVDTTTPSASIATVRTATVTRRDLIRTIDADGTLGYGTRRTVRGSGTGTITGLPETGAVISWNEPLYFVDNAAGPILMNGQLPMWRSLHSGVDDGVDVQQLESNLAIMGFNADGDLTIDENYTSATASAVKTWQESHDMKKTGRVEQGAVWFSPEQVRVAAVSVAIGDPVSGEILTVTATTRSIHVDLDAKYAQYAKLDGKVGIELADGATATGTISSVDSVATVDNAESGQPATTTVGIDITPDGQLDALDESPVTVSFTSDKLTGVLAVPVEAVVATADGRYAVEVVDANDSTRLVEVKLGRFADGWAQIDGEVTEGQKVVTA